MGLKRLTVKGDTVDFAIRKGLQEIGLPQEQTFIQIIQRESDTIFGYREAAISIVYDEDEANTAIAEKTFNEFRRKFKFRYAEQQAQVQVPAVFYDDLYLHNPEERTEFLHNYLRENGIEEPDESAIRNIVEDFQNQAQFVPIKTLECESLNEEGGSIHFRLDEEEMVCEVILFPGGEITEEQVVNYLKEKGILRGFRKGNIRRVLETGFIGLFDAARGEPAVHDRPGNIDKFFQEDEHKEFAQMIEDLTIDTRAIKEINIADRNQLLMRIGEIVPGRDGYTATGKILQRQELADTDEAVKLGDNVYMSDDGKEVYAKKSGHILWRAQDSYIDVEPVYIVEGNVDFSEGNIIGFVGKVIIKGDVKPKFSVVAEGDIEIHGSVEDATVRSTSGNVLVAGSVVHKMEGAISAKDTVQCCIATNAKVKARRILIEKESMNSHLDAEEEIIAEGTPGAIIGGKVEATHLIRANSIGSERGVPTLILVGDVTDLKKRLRTLHQRVMKDTRLLKEANQVLNILNSKAEEGQLSDSQKQQHQRTTAEVEDLGDSIEFAREEEEKLKKEIDLRRGARLEVMKDVHREVDIRIFEGVFIPTSKEQFTGFLCRKGRVQRYTL